jgi:hypothetical protein
LVLKLLLLFKQLGNLSDIGFALAIVHQEDALAINRIIFVNDAATSTALGKSIWTSLILKCKAKSEPRNLYLGRKN